MLGGQGAPSPPAETHSLTRGVWRGCGTGGCPEVESHEATRAEAAPASIETREGAAAISARLQRGLREKRPHPDANGGSTRCAGWLPQQPGRARRAGRPLMTSTALKARLGAGAGGEDSESVEVPRAVQQGQAEKGPLYQSGRPLSAPRQKLLLAWMPGWSLHVQRQYIRLCGFSRAFVEAMDLYCEPEGLFLCSYYPCLFTNGIPFITRYWDHAMGEGHCLYASRECLPKSLWIPIV